MLITNVTPISWAEDAVLEGGQAVFIDGGLIREVGSAGELERKHHSARLLDGRGQLLMPGNICAHTHFYGTFARGMAIPGRAPGDFPGILRKLWWPLDESLTEEDIRYSALVALVDAIRHGTTTLIDHHASPNSIDGSLDILAEAVDESGLRAVLCYEVTDRGGPGRCDAGIQENLRFLDRCTKEDVAGGRIAAAFGLHASLTLAEATLDRCREAAPAGTAFHVHVAEHESDQYDSLERSGMRAVDRLASHGLVNQQAILAHAVHVDPEEIAVLARSGARVTHQPRSNMNNAVGVADVEGMLRAGVQVCLGNDGFSNAMWQEWKTAYLLHKLANRDPRRLPADRIVQIAVHNNATLARTFFRGGSFGTIAPGAHADMMLVDYHAPTPLTPANLPWHAIFGIQSSMVTATIVAGRLLMWERQLTGLDEDLIAARASELAASLWERYPEHVPADRKLPLKENGGRS